MANNAVPKYRINRRLRGNIRMFSACQILPGDEIIAEIPLMSVPIALKEVYNANQALGTKSKYNVCPQLDQAYDQLSAENQKAITELFRIKDDLLSVFSCNAFQGDEKHGWYSQTVLRLFNDISRANHSCLPNAVFDWDPTRSVGTLHALQEIPPNTEIKIEYYPHETSSLRKAEIRREELRQQYAFECDCPACNESRHDVDNEDDIRRQKAARLWRSINKNEPHANESHAQAVFRKLRQTDEYVSILRHLGITDLKAADGWGRAAELQLEHFDLAETDYHQQHCGCINEGTRIKHLNTASVFLKEQIKYRICCWGVWHPDIAKDMEKMATLLRKILQHERTI